MTTRFASVGILSPMYIRFFDQLFFIFYVLKQQKPICRRYCNIAIVNLDLNGFMIQVNDGNGSTIEWFNSSYWSAPAFERVLNGIGSALIQLFSYTLLLNSLPTMQIAKNGQNSERYYFPYMKIWTNAQIFIHKRR